MTVSISQTASTSTLRGRPATLNFNLCFLENLGTQFFSIFKNVPDASLLSGSMANAPLSTLKRGVATAFGEDASQKSERNIQKRAKISKPPRQTAREVKPILSNNHPSKSQAGSSKPKRPPNSKKRNKSQALATKSKSGPRKGRKQEHGAPKTLTPAQQPSIKPDWTLSAPEAGRFLDHEPLLLQRDQLATPSICSFMKSF